MIRFLELNGFFRLPDDFVGSEGDAIRLLADYHDLRDISNAERVVTIDPAPKTRGELWSEFWQWAIIDGNGRVLMVIGIAHYDEPSQSCILDNNGQEP